MAEVGPLRYQALDPSGRTIRLLTLLPGQFEDDVYLSITHEEFQDEKRTLYECLSYTWGPAAQTQDKVHIWQRSPANVSLQVLCIQTNLLTALRHLRLIDAPRVIWVDAICIDQENPIEKGREVARMGQIYKNATQVLVWLGTEDESTPMARITIERLSVGIELTECRRYCSTIDGSEAAVVERHLKLSKLTPQHWISLRKFFQRPWFTRLWIRQEVLLASRVLVRCGDAEIEWATIEKVIVFIEQKVPRIHFTVKDILFCRSLFAHLGSDSLIYHLHRSSRCSHSDPRDIVYANLSISSEMKALQIRPDYTLTVADVFKDMTCKYLRHSKNLDLFRLCDLQSLPQGFKSFVPNFATSKPDSRSLSVYAHAGSRQLVNDAEGGNIEIKGRIVAKVQDVSTSKKPPVTNTSSGGNHMDIIKIYHKWEPEDLWTSATYPLGGTLLDAFVMLLSNGFCKETYPDPRHLPTIQESKASFLAAICSRGNANLIRDPEIKPYLGEVTSDRRSETFFRTVEGYIGASAADIKDGDIVTVLVGASVPIVLRSAADHLNAYQVVGPCFLQGVMLGQGLLGPLPEDWLCSMDRHRRWYFRKQGSEKKMWEDPRLWPLPSHWQVHFCDAGDNSASWDGSCEMECDKAGQLMNRWFLNTQSRERSKDDPRLDIQGLEAGGIALQTFTLV